MKAQIKRRSLALMAASALVPAWRAAAQARRSVLRFVPQSDLAGLDPVWTSAIVVRNHAYMVYDTLYGTDSQLQVRPQMAEGHESGADGLQWTIRLREGLRFHDGEPVRARDCVASIRRWAQRDGLGQILMQQTDELAPVDDRSFRFRLKAPFPMLVDVLGKFASPVLFIMPERVALTPANIQNTDPTGSGPFRFKPEEAVQGSHFAYEASTSYVPRDEPADNAAGGKRVHVAGVEWTVIPDPATAMSALRTGQVDWLEQPSADLLPLIEGDAGIATRPLDQLGSYVLMRFNHLYPPFDDVRVRQAVLLATDQAEFMAAMGGDPALARSCRSFFSCGTAEGEEAAPSAMPADVARARALVQASGHAPGQPMLILSPSDKPYLAGLAAEAADLMTRVGLRAFSA